MIALLEDSLDAAASLAAFEREASGAGELDPCLRIPGALPEVPCQNVEAARRHEETGEG